MVRLSSLVAALVSVAGTCLAVSVDRRTPDNSMLQYANDGVRYLGDWKWEWQPMTGSACSRSHHTSIVGAGVEMQFKGTSLNILGSFSNHPRLNITLDGVSELYTTASSTPGQPASTAYPCLTFWEKKSLKDGDHLVRVEILPETDTSTSAGGEFYFNGFQVDAGLVTPSSPPAQPLATASSASSSSSSGTTRPDMLVIGIVIGVVLFALLVSLLIVALVYRRRRNQGAAIAEKIGVQTHSSSPSSPPSGAPISAADGLAIFGYTGEKGDAMSFGYTNEKGETIFETKSDVGSEDARSRRSSASTLVPTSTFPAKSFKMLFTSSTPK